MADPICRWRNPYVATVIELISLLPKVELTRNQAREIVTSKSPYNFYKTPYQLACQLGLYHESNGYYFPKFTYNPTEKEVNEYLENWIIHYSVPNPYTRGFDNIQPFSIHSEICRELYETKTSIGWSLIRDNLFYQQIGNNDILINSINEHSPIISINQTIVQLKEGKTYEDLLHYINVDINTDRNNKEYFFDLFSLPNRNNIEETLITDVSKLEIDLINQIQKATNITQTEKNQIVKSRIGQGYFRRSLIFESPFCPITLIDDVRLLTASHIKPWKDSTNEERLNVKNGILLTPTFDRLFDKGFISFRNDKSLIISSLISDNTISKLKITQNMEIPHLPIVGREDFLDYHRSEILKT